MASRAIVGGGVTPASQANVTSQVHDLFKAKLRSFGFPSLDQEFSAIYPSVNSSKIFGALKKFLPVIYQRGSSSSYNVSSCPKYKIGDFAEGGVIIWLTEDGEHGLVAAITDASASSQWSTVNDNTPADFFDPLPLSYTDPNPASNYGGYKNQQAIEGLTSWQDYYLAFKAAFDYESQGYSDWFMPSNTELGVMFAMKELINKVSTNHGGEAMNQTFYWSSRRSQVLTRGTWIFQAAFSTTIIRVTFTLFVSSGLFSQFDHL